MSMTAGGELAMGAAVSGSEIFTPHWFGRYALVRLLGTGGMAEVFLARTRGARGFEKIVVLKRILPRLNQHAKYVELFVDEAKRLALLQHNNIVQVMDFDEHEGWPFIVMEYVHGKDLRRVLRRRRELNAVPPLDFAIFCTSELLKALAATHSLENPDGTTAHLLHRDVTPDNVFVSYRGEVKLGDFGVSHLVGKVDPNELRGKMAYSAPEVTQGLELDQRADIFSAGVVLWELLTGTYCYDGSDPAEVALQIRETPARPPSLCNALVPPEIDRLVLKAIDRDRDRRFQSASEFDDALTDFIFASGLRCSRRRSGEFMHTLFGNETSALELPPAPPWPGNGAHPAAAEVGRSDGVDAADQALAGAAAHEARGFDGRWLEPDDALISDLVERITSPLRPLPRVSALGPAPATAARAGDARDEVTAVDRLSVWFRGHAEPVGLDIEQLISHLAQDASEIVSVGGRARSPITVGQLGNLLYWDSLVGLPIPDEQPIAEASLGAVSMTRLWWSLSVRRLTGLVLLEEATHGRRRLLALKEGIPLYVHSDEPHDGTLAIAQRHQMFSPSVLFDAVSQVVEQHVYLDHALVTCIHAADPAQAREMVRRAFAAILLIRMRGTIGWTSGRFCIYPSLPRARYPSWNMPTMLSTLVPAVRRSLTLAELEQRLGAADDRAAFVTPRGAALLPALKLKQRDNVILASIDGKRGIAQILRANRAESESERLRVLSLLYVLTETNVVEMV